jgi:hypothetical protein
MYAEHQPAISEWAFQNPRNMLDVLVFVQLSIRQHIENMPFLMDNWRTFGLNTKSIGPVQRRRIKAYAEVAQASYDLLCRARQSPMGMRRSVLLHLLNLPGFGIPKAGFVVQLTLGTMGCLDSHNLYRYGLDLRAFRSDNCSTATLYERIEAYLGVVDYIGPETLWNDWCHYISNLRSTAGTPEQISEYHARAIIGWEYKQCKALFPVLEKYVKIQA